MSKNITNIFLAIIALSFTGCYQNTHSSTWHGSSGVGYQYDIPGNYDLCGVYGNDHGFDMYCFLDFEAMHQCLYETVDRKEYFQCDYHSHIKVEIESKITEDGLQKSLDFILERDFPNLKIVYHAMDRNGNEFTYAEIKESNEDRETPVYLSVIPFGEGKIAKITSIVTAESNLNLYQKAYEIVVESLAPFAPPQ